MEKVLKLYKYIDGINDSPFPSESEQIVVANFRYDAKRMSSAPTIAFTSMHRTCLDDLWSDNVYAIFNGERYFIKQTPTSSYSNADTRYKHEVELVSERSILDNVFFYDVVTEDGAVDKPVSNSPKFSFYGDIHEYVSRLNNSLSFSGLEYSIVVDEGVNSNESLVSFDSQVITNALQEIYNIYNIPYYFNGKVIHVGYYKDDIDYVFKYGANDSLISISKQNANSKIINRITGVGSSDNIPYYYPNDDARGITRPLLNGGASGVSVINTIKYKKLRLSDELKYYSSINELVPLLNDGVFEVSNIKHLGVDESTGLTRYMIDFYYTFTLDDAKKVKFDIWSVDLEKTEDLKYNISKEGGQNFGYFSGEKDLELNDGTYTLIVRWLFFDEQPALENDESTYNFINLYVGVSANIVVEASESWTLKGLPILLSDYGLNVDSASNGDVITIELLSYIQPQQNLMPPIYRYFLERFYEAKDNTFVDDKTGDYYVFENEYSTTHPREHIENFDNIKPTIKNVTNEHGDRIDRFVDFAYDLDDNDETDQDGNFYHPYFFAKLNKTNGIKGFNLFEHSIDESDMTISVTSGSCGSCEFIIGVDENTQKNLVQVDEYGDLLRDGNGNVRCGRKGMQKETPQDVQNDTENNEVWIALKKDIQTFGVVMPNATNNYKPSIGDTFVILHIDLPKTYIEEAEKKLEQELIRYMHDNNAEKFNFSISFSRIFFAEKPSILERLSENSKIKIEYNKQVYELYASSLSYSISNDSPLPEIKIDLNDTIAISQNQINQVVNSAKKDIISSIKKDVLWGDIKGVPSWITSEKPKYSYNEILGSVPQEESDVWVIKKDSNGNAYLFTTFPVVTQYGITMYSGDGVNIPSLASGLPFDGRTIWYNPDTQQIEVIGGTGGGAADTVAWEGITGKPEWITNTKPVYNYTEIQGIPDLSVYAKSSDVTALSGKLNDFLDGSDTDNIINKWKELESFLSGLSESDNLATILLTKADKTYVDDTFVTLATSQTITGEKNFTGGLKVNGSPIFYDSAKKYWKLEGDLLVTGGVTMYGNDSSFTPSTIMDAIAVDGTTISKSGGVLKVIGGVGASTMGSLSNVGTWADSVADADRIMYQAAGSSSWTSKPLSSITGVSGDYLPLSGGTITGDLYIGNSNNTSWMPLRFNRNGKTSFVGQGLSSVDVGFDDGHLSVGPDYFRYIKSPSQQYAVWHEGNDGSGSGLDADLLDGKQPGELNVGSATRVMINYSYNQDINYPIVFTSRDNIGVSKNGDMYIDYIGRPTYNPKSDTLTVGNLLGNASSANVLATSYIENINYGTYHSALKLIYNIQNDNYGFPDHYVSGLSVMAGYTGWQLMSYGGDLENPYFRSLQDTGAWKPWKRIAFLTDNVASATKLQTAKTIWGQSFDGTGNVSGHLTGASSLRFSGDIGIWQGNIWTSLNTDDIAYYATRHVFYGNVGIGTIRPKSKLSVDTYVVTDITSGSLGTPNTVGFGYVAGGCGTYFWTSPNANGHIQVGREDGNAVSYHLILQELGGNVGIGESNPTDKLHVSGDIRLKDSSNYGCTIYFGDGEYCYLRESSDDQLTIHANQGLIIADNTTINSNLLVSGGITMYSMRALKNVVDERGLSLSELSTIKPTRYTWKDGRDNRLHFGGIADDIQQVLPEVVYSTSDGILTMDYGNAAFAVASSLINPVINHEKRIAMLQERIVELEEEVERLKAN